MKGFFVVIPARYASQRLPGKPLREIAGKPMLQHVFERATESKATRIVIATDDQRIADSARGFAAEVCMTSDQHTSGTERLAEVSQLLQWDSDQVVVNLQGDEPLMPATLINECAALLTVPGTAMATLASKITGEDDFNNPNVVKVVTDANDIALYFSRAAIPYSRHRDTDTLAMATALQHHGIYAYRVDTLSRLVRALPAELEKCEQLEQLRALSIGIEIRVGRPSVRPGPGVDTEHDLHVAEQLLTAGTGNE